MRRLRVFPTLIAVVIVLGTLIADGAAGAPPGTVSKSTVAKVGAVCKKAGVVGTTAGGVSVTCTKVAKKLIWQETRTPSSTVPSTTPPAECLLPNPPQSCAPAGVGAPNTVPVSARCSQPNPPQSCSPAGTPNTVPVSARCSQPNPPQSCSPGGTPTQTTVPSTTPPTQGPPPALVEYVLPVAYKNIFAGSDYDQSPRLAADFIFGHTLTDYFSDAYAPYADSALQSIKNSGVGWVVFDNYYTYTSLEPPKISPFPRVGFENLPYHMRDATDTELVAMIKSAHAKGLKFFLFSELNLNGLTSNGYGVTSELLDEEAKIDKRLEELAAAISDPTPEVTKFWDDWFITYGDFVVHQADIAQQNGVEMFSIGKQLGGATAPENVARWKALIARVRAHYSGPIVYVALEGNTFSEAAGFPAWADLDAIVMNIGGDLVPPTAGQTVAQIRDALKPVLVSRYQKFATQYGKKVIFLAYFQAATTQEWYESGPVTGGHDHIIKDQLAQAKLYEALFQAIKNESWVSGVLTWSYYWKDDLTSLVVAGDSSMDKFSTVRNQPAMEIIRRWAAGR